MPPQPSGSTCPGCQELWAWSSPRNDELVTEIYFARGAILARAFRVRQPESDEADDTSLVVRAAQQLAERLEAIEATSEH